MTDKIGTEELMRYLDGESPPEERTRIEEALAGSTEVNRELALFMAMKEDLSGIQFDPEIRRESVWDRVNSRLTRPIGWILFWTGTVVIAIYGAYLYFTSSADLLEKLATGAMVVGIILLLISVIWEQYRVWLTDPYRDVQR